MTDPHIHCWRQNVAWSHLLRCDGCSQDTPPDQEIVREMFREYCRRAAAEVNGTIRDIPIDDLTIDAFVAVAFHPGSGVTPALVFAAITADPTRQEVTRMSDRIRLRTAERHGVKLQWRIACRPGVAASDALWWTLNTRELLPTRTPGQHTAELRELEAAGWSR